MKPKTTAMETTMTRGQGAQSNPHNRFAAHQREISDEFLNYLVAEGEENKAKTRIIEVHPKTIINEVKSPDVNMPWSLNPYQGCEHGCAYCYARNSHEYWGYSAGIDFERTLLIKKSAPALLDATLSQKSWKASPIVLSGNTDCYQPIERKLGITRQLIEVFRKHLHPMGIITKNALIQRDIDLLAPMAERNLVHVIISLTTLDDGLRKSMEPRTASVKKRLETIAALSVARIPVTVMMAPVIPGLNSHEIFDVLSAAKNAGARDAHYTVVRLNGKVAHVFTEWIEGAFPDRASKVLAQIAELHNGSLHDHRPGLRMRGSGKVAETIKGTFGLARKKVFGNPERLTLNCTLHAQTKNPQLRLF